MPQKRTPVVLTFLPYILIELKKCGNHPLREGGREQCHLMGKHTELLGYLLEVTASLNEMIRE